MILHLKPLTQLMAVAALAIVAGALSPSRVVAGCGDYVMVGGKHMPASAHADVGATGKPAPMTPCPCKGPGCSQAPKSPIVPPAPPSSLTASDWACFEAKPSEQGGGVAHGLHDDSLLSPIRRINSIYHPPRFSA